MLRGLSFLDAAIPTDVVSVGSISDYIWVIIVAVVIVAAIVVRFEIKRNKTKQDKDNNG